MSLKKVKSLKALYCRNFGRKVTIHYTLIKSLSESDIETAIAKLPGFLKTAIQGYKNPADKLRVLGGKLLLQRSVEHWGLKDQLPLAALKYNMYKRPYFDYPFVFSTSHSGCFAIVAATSCSAVGVDIEQIKPLNIQEFRQVFTLKEWNSIQSENSFFRIWTRKEAIVKALGTGFYQDLTEIDVTAETCQWKDQKFWLYDIQIHENFASSLAVASPVTQLELYPIDWSSLF